MDKEFLRRSAGEILRAVLFTVLFSLLALALVAVCVRAFAPAQSVVTAVNWGVKCVGIFVFCLLFIRKERALFKGLIAGVAACLFTMLVFGIIGGFHLNAFFLLELVVCAIVGGAGALLGAKLRKA